MRSHYYILGVDKSATLADIKKAYKAQARMTHPDMGGQSDKASEENFKAVKEAYRVLSDPQLRREYDGSPMEREQHPFEPLVKESKESEEKKKVDFEPMFPEKKGGFEPLGGERRS